MNCPCGTDALYDQCCGPYHEGTDKAPTAETLMRSRYSAFVVHNADYVVATNHASTRDDVDLEDIKIWSEGVEWTGLQVLKAEGDERTGTVEFVASYVDGGKTVEHHELSDFVCDDGVWFYVDGKMMPKVRKTKKVGPNAMCPCGSEKKFKRCCGRP